MGRRLSVNEIANKLRISCQAIYQLIKNKGVKPAEFVTEGKSRIALYDIDELPKYAEALKDTFSNEEKLATTGYVEVPPAQVSPVQYEIRTAPDQTIDQFLGDAETDPAAEETEQPFYTTTLDNLTPELINSYVLLFGQDGAKNILVNNYGLRP